MTTTKKFIFTLLMAIAAVCSMKAAGWPANFEGVMMQAFYWDSYQTETKWTKLEAKSDEYSKYFKLLWVPNSGKSTGGLGYIPIYWFTNHNSDMGSEAQLRSMINTYKSKGTGIIADFVVNHRGGATNWADFPSEKWNGQTWKIGMDGICRTDEINNPGNPGGATGANDEGQDFDGGRDLDHTNANVQNNCKNYAKCLLEDFGYVGFRLDMVKGYAGYYTKMYNQYAKPTYSVGEYWDGYDNIAAWIESTGKESAAFDFPFKYACNEAFSSGDMTKLTWHDGTKLQPAGLIHREYRQYAVTFLDNHDTYRNDWNKFNGNWAAANAFMICSPGTPCVFLPHWNACGDQIAKMIEARNLVGITNTSAVTVLKSDYNCYMAEVTGSRGKLVVKIGPAMVSPSGYSDSQIYCSGEDYCIWTNATTPTYPTNFYLMGHFTGSDWTPGKGVAAKGSNGKYTWNGITIEDAGEGYGYVGLCEKTGSTWDAINAGRRFGPGNEDEPLAAGKTGLVSENQNSFKIAVGTYNLTFDLAAKTVTLTAAGSTPTPDPDPDPTPDTPADLYLVGNILNAEWNPAQSIKMEKSESTFSAMDVELVGADGGNTAYFSFTTKQGNWETVNSYDRYGAESKDKPITPDTPLTIKKFVGKSNTVADTYSWAVAPGKYNIYVDFKTMQVNIAKTLVTSVSNVEVESSEPIYFNLQGVRIDNPKDGIFIRVCGTKATKVYIK